MQIPETLSAANETEADAVPVADQPQPLDSRAHAGDGNGAAQESGAIPIAEAMAHAIAQTGHQHAAAAPEDAPQPARLPFPRPPFDLEKAWRRIIEKDAEVTGLMTEALRADNAAKAAAERKKAGNEALNGAYLELHDLIRHYKDEQAAAGDGEQLEFEHGPECGYERAHPGKVCGICGPERERARAAAEDRLQLATEEPGPTPRNDESLRDVLLVLAIADPTVAIPEERITLDTMATWSDETYRQVQGWAAAKELAKTEPNVVVPPMPVVIGGHHADDDEYGLVEDEQDGEDEELFTSDDDDAPVDLVVGAIAVAIQDLMNGCAEGERAVCYQVDTVDGRPSYGFIFQNGWYDGFSPDDVRQYLSLTGEVCEALTWYRFTSVSKLTRDHRKGVFAAAFDTAGAEP